MSQSNSGLKPDMRWKDKAIEKQALNVAICNIDTSYVMPMKHE